ncbi:MAG: VWA domain-containing protein [Candidatus Korobacteraceae bacterium]
MISRSKTCRTAAPISLITALLVSTIPLRAQVSSQPADDVHIVPHTAPSGVATENSGVPLNSLRVDVNLVLVPVTVTDPLNHPVLTLRQQDFTLFEGLAQQQIRYFSKEDAPISVALVLDCSASMKNKIEYERQAVEQFFNNANADDEYFAVTVSDKPQLIASAADSVGTLQDRLGSSPPKGRTALFDAIYLAIAKLRSSRYQRRALLIISDGGDNTSRYTRSEIKSVIEEADVLTYAIGLFDEEPIPLLKTVEERMGRDWLSELTDASGGRTIAADNRQKIPEIAAMVSRELRSQYLLGYRPSDPSKNGKWRRIRVKVVQPSEPVRLQVHYKEGYRAPQE